MSQTIRLPETLSDGVVVLNGHSLSDAQAHFDGEDAEMMRRFEASRHSTLEETCKAIQRWMDARVAGAPNFCYAIRARDGLLAGGCEVRWLTVPPDTLGISYWCYPRFRGRAFARRAVALTLNSLSETRAEQIEAHIEADNIASRKIAERAGFVEDGTVTEVSANRAVTRLRYTRAIR